MSENMTFIGFEDQLSPISRRPPMHKYPTIHVAQSGNRVQPNLNNNNSSSGSPDNLSTGSFRKCGTQFQKQLSNQSFIKLLSVQNKDQSELATPGFKKEIPDDEGSSIFQEDSPVNLSNAKSIEKQPGDLSSKNSNNANSDSVQNMKIEAQHSQSSNLFQRQITIKN